jgi:hypothetical protein
MMALWSTGIVPLLAAAGTLNEKGVATRVGAVGNIIVRGVTLVTGTDHIVGDALTSSSIEGKVLADEVRLDLGF